MCSNLFVLAFISQTVFLFIVGSGSGSYSGSGSGSYSGSGSGFFSGSGSGSGFSGNSFFLFLESCHCHFPSA